MAEIRAIDWTPLIELFERFYVENLAMREILTTRVANFDWKEFDAVVAEIELQGDVHRYFGLLYRAAAGDPNCRDAIRDFAQLRPYKRKKPN